MKQSKLLILLVIVFALLLTSCTNLFTPNNTQSDSSDSSKLAVSKAEEILEAHKSADSKKGEVSETTESTTSPKEKALINVDYMTDELLNKYNSFDEFIEDESLPRIIFTTNITVKDFKFIEIDFRDGDEDFTFFESKVLSSLEELSPEKPFVVTWMEQGTIPHRGISFIDETDTTRYFYIAMSGKDGSIFIDEFKNE